MVELTRLEHQMNNAAREFARGEFDRERFYTMSKAGKFPGELLRKACETGLLGIHLPGEYGGGEGFLAEQAIVLNALSAQDSTAGFAIASGVFGVECIAAFGSSAMKKELLPAVLSGRKLCTAAFYEHDIQDVSQIFECRAKKTDSGWQLNGTKSNVLNGALADYFLVICSTGDPAAGGESMFLVDKAASGIEIMDQGPRFGLEMVSSSTMSFNDTTIPFSSIIGQPGAAREQLKFFYCIHWVLLAALGVGMAKGAFRRSLSYISQRKQFGKPIAAFGISRDKIGAMSMKIELADLAVRSAAQACDRGKPQMGSAAVARLTAADTAVAICDESVQLMGGYGYMAEYEVEHFLRDAKSLDLLYGEKAMLKDIISQEAVRKS